MNVVFAESNQALDIKFGDKLVIFSVFFVTNCDTVIDNFTYKQGYTAQLPILSQDDYNFLGWYESADFSGSAVTHITASDIGNKKYYAKWIKKDTGTAGLSYELSEDGTYYILKGIGTASAERNIEVGDSIQGKPVKEVGDYAFKNCANIKSLTIPNSVVKIGKEACNGCSALESLTIPFIGDVVERNENDTFQYPLGYIFGSTQWQGSATLGQQYLNDGKEESVTYYIPSNLNKVIVTGGNILFAAFYQCRQLTTIVLPNNIKSIGDDAFFYCTGFVRITIPNTVTKIGSNAFYSISRYAEVDFSSFTHIPTIESNTFISGKGIIIVPDNLYNEWKAATNWSKLSSYIKKASEYN